MRSRPSYALLAALALASCSRPAPEASRAQGAGPGAIRLHLQPWSSVVPLGTPVELTIALRDAQGDRASAPHALSVELSVERGPPAKVEFRPGDTEMDVSVTPTREGILEIRAVGRELVPGTCAIKVTRAQARTPAPRQHRER